MISKFKKNIRKKESNGGFTLVEMLIAIGLFALIASVSIGAIVAIFDANSKAKTSKTVVDNLNFAIENMARTVRFGHGYHCGSDGDLTSPQNCANNTNGDTFLAVQFYDSSLDRDKTVVYRYNDVEKSIERSNDGGPYEPITAPEAEITYVKFYVFGANEAGGTDQPYVLAVIKGYVGTKSTTQSSFIIQTIMSERDLDL